MHTLLLPIVLAFASRNTYKNKIRLNLIMFDDEMVLRVLKPICFMFGKSSCDNASSFQTIVNIIICLS